MKKFWLVFVLALCVQLACEMQNLDARWACTQQGGTWHYADYPAESWCEMPPNAETDIPSGNEAGVNPQNEPSSTHASPQTCNATMYIVPSIEITSERQESEYRECEYTLSLSHTYKVDSIWVLRRMNVDILDPTHNTHDQYWYSNRVYPLEAWEGKFLSTYFTNGQYRRTGVDRIAGVFDTDDCLYLLTSPEIETISVPVEWACAP